MGREASSVATLGSKVQGATKWREKKNCTYQILNY
jgi:hypothetical protein